MLLCLAGQVFIIQIALAVHAVGHEVVVFARHVHRAAVGQVPAVGQIHAQHGVARLQQGKIHGQIGLGARVGLHVGVLGAEQFTGTAAGDILHLVHIGAAAVIAVAGITLGVLIGQHRAHGGQHRRRDDVLRGDQLDVAALAGKLPLHGVGHLRVAAAHEADGIQHVLVQFHSPPISCGLQCIQYTSNPACAQGDFVLL